MSFLGSAWALGWWFLRREGTEWVAVRCFKIDLLPIWALGNSTGYLVRELHYAVVGTDTSSRRLFLRLQDTLLPFLGAPWMNFTHTLSCLNCTRNLQHTNTPLNVIRVGRQIKSFDQNNQIFFSLLIWDVNEELLPVCIRGPGAVKFGDDLNEMFTAE